MERSTGGACGVNELALEDLARRVAELLADRVREPFRLLDSQTVAGMLGVSEDWVREHSAELGAIRIGDGPKGRAALRHRAGAGRAESGVVWADQLSAGGAIQRRGDDRWASFRPPCQLM